MEKTKYGLLTTKTVFDPATVKALIQTRDLLDELLDTLDVMSNEENLKKLAEAEEDVKKGRVKNWEQFLKEVKDEV